MTDTAHVINLLIYSGVGGQVVTAKALSTILKACDREAGALAAGCASGQSHIAIAGLSDS